MIKVKTHKDSRSCQGDIYKNVEFVEYIVEKKGVIEISKIIFPYVIVLTQDCELQQDYTFRKQFKAYEKATKNKMLLSVLVAPLYNADHVFLGKHLEEINIDVATIPKNTTRASNIMQNETPRYHFLEFPENISISDSIIDFKHYFSVNVEYLRKIKMKNYVCKVSELYREDISLRFANYLSRIGLPEITSVS